MDSVDTDEFKDIFSMFDKRGDGKIECIEIGNLIRTLGLNPSQIDIDKMIKDVDPSGKKRITFEEFLPLYMTQSQKKTAAGLDHFLEAFRVFDKDSTGTISAAELRHVLTCLGEKLTEEDIENLFSGLEDSHGQINYEEMVKMVYSG